MPDLVIKKSKIEGMGVFAGRDFKKGEVVIKWDISHQLTPEEISKLQESERKYVTHVQGKHILMQPPTRYVNHSCDANTRLDDFRDIATRDIRKGEEITGNYPETLNPGVAMKCNCGSKNCRGIIRATASSP